MLGKWERDAWVSNAGTAQIVTGATITVKKESDGGLAAIYSDEAGGTPITNPFTPAGSAIAFYASIAERYRIDIVKGADSRTLRHEPVSFEADDVISVLLAQPNTWAQPQTFSGNNSYSGNNTHSGTETHSKSVYWAKGADIASAATLTLGTDGNYFHVTGTTTITAISTLQAGARILLEFDGALTLTHNATSLILPSGKNITTVAGDMAEFVSEGSGNWRCVHYRAIGWTAYTPTITAGSGTFTTVSAIGRYRLDGKLCHISISINITTNGTAAGNVYATLPFTAGSTIMYQWAGREQTAGAMLQGAIPTNATTVYIVKYDNTYPGANGYQLVVSGAYEIA